MSKISWIILSVVTITIAVAAVILVVAPAPKAKPIETEKIRVTSPMPESVVSTTFTVTGEARGPWFFEASFPLEVRDSSGKTLAISYATAGAEWMTEDFVPFSGQIIVENYTGPAVLILHKDNASGLPQYDDSVSLPIAIQGE